MKLSGPEECVGTKSILEDVQIVVDTCVYHFLDQPEIMPIGPLIVLQQLLTLQKLTGRCVVFSVLSASE